MSVTEQNMNTDSTGKVTVNWTRISKELNRGYYDCQNRYNTLSKADLKVGRFTPEEDMVIAQEWAANQREQRNGRGLWMALEKTLGRRNDVIRKRWQNVLSKKVQTDLDLGQLDKGTEVDTV
jgi:hypothetical protein